MADPEPLLLVNNNSEEEAAAAPPTQFNRSHRVASVDVFRGLSVFLMILVDYGGSIFPIISHSPWNGLHLADFVMPFFLFLVGISLSLLYKRISIGYILAALCEIWLPTNFTSKHTAFFFTTYYSHWFVAAILLAIYSGLLYGLYVPDWQFNVSSSTSSLPPIAAGHLYMVNCSVRGDLGPACNSAGMIDRYILGFDHLYQKPVFRNLKECNMSSTGQVSDSSPSWCHAPFEPEGILSSITAAVSCIIGLQYGHVLAHLEDHKGRLNHWLGFSVSFLTLGGFLALIGIPLNKSLYTISYMLLSSAASGLTFMALYVLVDVYGYRRLTSVLEWMGKHSLSIFVLVSSNLAVIAIQGFYWTKPENNIVHWIVSQFHHK
ncbi:unnamed protein product [Trifolium pratense]|uniref:Uncharacterized protein n=1 Tax=Trifolium pratense TaxID=57577 RepID=A0ACB0JD40_TRIPR|nr:unnamed protein product [Trifolium pratense]